MTSAGLDWDREKWRGSVASKFIRGGEKNAVKYADEIIVLDADGVKERGTHESLMAKNGEYATLYRYQFRE